MKQLTVDHAWIETVTVDGAPVERERSVHLVVATANLRMGIRRSLLIEEQRAICEKSRQDLVDQGFVVLDLIATELLRTQMYPSLVAGVVDQTGFDRWPITYEEFMELPEELGIKWEEALGSLNPHWTPKPDPQTMEDLEEARKKAMNGTPE